MASHVVAGVRFPTAHPQLVQRSAQLYLGHLSGLAATDGKVRTAARALTNSVEAAARLGTSLTAGDIEFDKFYLGALSSQDRGLFVNEYSLGLGRDDADVIVMGTEHAYDIRIPAEVVNFSLENCASQILWLSGGPPDVVEKISGLGFWQPTRPGRSTFIPTTTIWFTFNRGAERGRPWPRSSDVNHLACRHLTSLDRLVAHGELPKPTGWDLSRPSASAAANGGRVARRSAPRLSFFDVSERPFTVERRVIAPSSARIVDSTARLPVTGYAAPAITAIA